MRRLVEAAEAKSREAWFHTAKLLQMLADLNAPKTAPHAFAMFHPWAGADEVPTKTVPFRPADLRAQAAAYWRSMGKTPPAEWEAP